MTNHPNRGSNKQITIVSALHEGIYKSHGGGQRRVHYRWTIGPRNLLSAIQTLREHSDTMTSCYGNVGHCDSWIEIAGHHVALDTLNEITPDSIANARAEHEREGYHFEYPQSATEQARQLISRVVSGEYTRVRNENAKQYDLAQKYEMECYYAGRAGGKMPDKPAGLHDYCDAERQYKLGKRDSAT